MKWNKEKHLNAHSGRDTGCLQAAHNMLSSQTSQRGKEAIGPKQTNTKTTKEKDIKVNLQAPQGGWWRWKKVLPGVALLHHHHGPQLGLARHHQRHHDLVGRLQQLPATAKLQQQLLKHISPTFTLSYSAQVLTINS